MIFFERKILKMLFLGFSSGLPILLVFSTLSVWLVKAGINRSTVTLFSWAGFAYAFKYLWSPIVDNFKIPFFQKLGHRRSWLFFSQAMIIVTLIATAFTDPANNLLLTAITITLVAIFSATQDIVIDAFRIESAPQRLQGPLSSMYIAGYRIAMLVGGAGSLWLAALLGNEIYNSWLQKISLVKEYNDYLILGVPTRFFRDWIVSRYLDKILEQVKSIKLSVNRIEFKIIEENKQNQEFIKIDELNE